VLVFVRWCVSASVYVGVCVVCVSVCISVLCVLVCVHRLPLLRLPLYWAVVRYWCTCVCVSVCVCVC